MGPGSGTDTSLPAIGRAAAGRRAAGAVRSGPAPDRAHPRPEPTAEVACGHIPLPVSKSTGSHHFKVLREAGVVRARDEGTRRFYPLRRDDLDARFPGLLDSILAAAAATSPSAARHLP